MNNKRSFRVGVVGALGAVMTVAGLGACSGGRADSNAPPSAGTPSEAL
jgi:hypothetical protein